MFSNSTPNAKAQPFSVFFDLTMGGLRQIYHNPKIPLDFELNIEKSWSMKMDLFDWTGFDAEPYFWESNDQGTFKFGYSNGTQSEEIPFLITNYGNAFSGSDSVLTLDARLNKQPFYSCNQLNGTAENSLNDFCKTHGYQLQINPAFGTQYMQEVGKYSKFSTEKREMTHTKRQNETDWSYIQRLTQKCRDPSGKTGYVCHETTDGNGNKVLRVSMPPATAGNADYHFVVQEQDTNVVHWGPTINFEAGLLGANDVHWNSHQAITGDYQKFNMQQTLMSDLVQRNGYQLRPLIKSSPPKAPCTQIIQAGGAENFESGSVNGAMRMRSPGSPSPYAGFNSALYQTSEAMLGCNSASLTIQGDPAIQYLKTVQVDCFYPVTYGNLNDARKLHYSSGLWRIQGVRHNISRSNEFLTTMTLVRMAPGNVPQPGVTQ